MTDTTVTDTEPQGEPPREPRNFPLAQAEGMPAGVLGMSSTHGGRLTRASSSFQLPADGQAGDIVRALLAWTGWQLDSIYFAADAWGPGAAAKVGCYRSNGGAVILPDAFGEAPLADAHPYGLLAGAGGGDPRHVGIKLRHYLEMSSSEPDTWVDIALTVVTPGNAAAEAAMVVHYVE
jgi:hypothetical protein